MAEPGQEPAATPPPPPQETVRQAPDDGMPEPILVTPTPITGTAAGGAAALDSALPKAESAHWPPPQETKAAALEKKPTPSGEMPPPQKASKAEGETKTAALDGKLPVPGKEQVAATVPPPAEASSPQETTATATATAAEAEAEKQLAAPAPQLPPRKQEGGAGAGAPVQEEKGAATAAARPQEGEVKPARRRWRWLRDLFLRRKGGETKPPPTPGEMPPPADSGAGRPAAEKGEDEKKKKPSSALGGEKKPASGQEEPKPAAPPADKKPSRKFSAGAAMKPKDDGGERSKGRRDEIENETQAGKAAAAAAATPPLEAPEAERPLLKKLKKAIGRVLLLNSWYRKHRRAQSQSQSQEEKKPAETAAPAPGAEEDDDGKAKPEEKEKEKQPASSVLEDDKKKTTTQHHRNWEREEMRLEHILEEAFMRLVAAEYSKELSRVRQRCLLTFSVFELASEVKKQAMIYWWVAEFNLRHRSDHSPDDDDDNAEGIFFTLSDQGFLVPIKNWCSKVIHGCQVNPLVHWMLKRQARADRFAELDERGSPAELQLSSGILCLTAANRPLLQRMRVEDESQQQSQAQAGKRSKKVTKEPSKKDEDPTQAKDEQLTKDQQQPTTKDDGQVGSKSMAAADKAPSQKHEDPTQVKDQGGQNIKPSSEPTHVDVIIPPLFEGKRVILNVNAHVYPISRSAFLKLAECLVVLQLGRWNNLDDKTYMEVDGLESSRNVIGLLKNLRYLGLRGLSRLAELPKGIESLKKLVILDMRGCQNLVKVVANVIKQLKQLTHLDLTECYMLEHIGQGITSLTELQVFKGFVFATGTQRKQACHIQDLKKLKKLQKLTISITTDANVGKGEMAELKNLTSLRKLTITWSEIPSILECNTKKVKDKQELVEKWTSFHLPKDLMKLDIRCYPKEKLELEHHEKLEKLYLRGGDVKTFSTNKSTSIKTLRLRYLKNFQMGWEDIRLELEKIEYVEIVVNKDATQEKDMSEVTKDKEDKEDKHIKNVMKIPAFTLDKHGVWTKDQKEEDNKQKLHAPNKDAIGENKGALV